MNKTKLQKIFRNATVSRMRSVLKSGESLETYFQEAYPVDDKDCLFSTIEVAGEPPRLKTPPHDLASADLENAIQLYEYYGNLNEVQASDPRLWAYLSHVEFRKYSLVRWGLKWSFDEINKNDLTKQKSIVQLLEHWFVSANDRDLRRHAIARLWWAAHLTCAPWEKDSGFFADLKNDDRYYFTRILFSTQDIYQSVLERAMGRSNHILISVLEFLDNNKEFAKSREKIRSLIKELNLAYGTKKLIVLDRSSLAKLINNFAEEIEKSPE